MSPLKGFSIMYIFLSLFGVAVISIIIFMIFLKIMNPAI